MGNALMEVAVRCAKAQMVARGFYQLEQPTSSLMLVTDSVVNLKNDAPVYRMDREVCADGAPWKKATALIANNACITYLDQKCNCGQGHIALAGKAANNRNWTAIASSYWPMFALRTAGCWQWAQNGVVECDRGAEQGDPHGNLQCGAVLADMSAEATRSFSLAAPGAPMFDVWYADDAQALCRPAHLDDFLRTLDEAAAKRGSVRGRGSDCKSRVRLIGHPDALAAFAASEADTAAGSTMVVMGSHPEPGAWVTEYVAESCIVDTPNAAFECLGTIVGDDGAFQEQFARHVRKTEELYELIGGVLDPAAELALGRACGSVRKAW